jgi:hypothetical protein
MYWGRITLLQDMLLKNLRHTSVLDSVEKAIRGTFKEENLQCGVFGEELRHNNDSIHVHPASGPIFTFIERVTHSVHSYSATFLGYVSRYLAARFSMCYRKEADAVTKFTLGNENIIV